MQAKPVKERIVRLGVGAGYAGDRIDPAVDLVEQGNVDYLVFECLAERTIALAQQARRLDPAAGYNGLLEDRMRAVLPGCRQQGIPIITNMGAANPLMAARKVAEIARELGLEGVRVAAVLGDDVLHLVTSEAHRDEVSGLPALQEFAGRPEGALDQLISANAYLGARAVVGALAAGANVVITGRVSDPVLFMAPLIHEFGWSFDDFDLLGQATVIGHLLECSAQVTGGYFADPGLKDVPDLDRIGYPIAEVSPDGTAIITKLASAGGMVTEATCKEQLLYEIHDPSNYFQPDVIADFTGVSVTEVGKDRVRVTGGRGKAPNGMYKTVLGYLDGYIGEGQISYAGIGALARAQLARSVVEARIARLGIELREVRFDLLGVDSVFGRSFGESNREPAEVRLRVAGRTFTAAEARRIGQEFETLWALGPAGGGGATQSVREVVAVTSILLPRDEVTPTFEMVN